MEYHYLSFVHKTPKRTSILSGPLWVDEVLCGNSEKVLETFRMSRATFYSLLATVTSVGGLKRTCHVSETEQLAIFLFFVGQRATSRAMQERFQRSGETITRHLRAVLKALKRLCSSYIMLPAENAPCASKIQGNPKFFPFFQHCRMAIDGTHIPVSVGQDVVARFQSRKGITMNVLAACDFDLQFTYVLAGWEGTAGDGKLYEAAKQAGLALSGTGYDILDAGFGLTKSALTPYRGTRYHLKEFALGSRRPQKIEELFNLRHASLRNVIERIIGVLKKSCRDQVEEDAIAELRRQNGLPMRFEDRAVESLDAESDEAKAWRDSIATQMWTQYKSNLRARQRCNGSQG
ncbi:hypothetical protein H257_19400 [Aphanomyces astaci]|uniref:Uncharacterized protein n=1 Tax=Aphanomyces astaci TaxID=112090 RepID=W4FA29_APHAT|nr:hypothetical protein H257_19400 [Aphanomyces astaci]ETV63666.1 hypothetical protein H257_19400 [Aphanomyces astaci]|eukprot:XP_009846849.1 hypothetical protein H257_19400 [Aphanomyces astaci]